MHLTFWSELHYKKHIPWIIRNYVFWCNWASNINYYRSVLQQTKKNRQSASNQTNNTFNPRKKKKKYASLNRNLKSLPTNIVKLNFPTYWSDTKCKFKINHSSVILLHTTIEICDENDQMCSSVSCHQWSTQTWNRSKFNSLLPNRTFRQDRKC